MSEIIIKPLTKVRQQEQVLYKIRSINDEYANGIRPKDLARMIGFPEPTIRRILKIHLKDGRVSCKRVNCNTAFYKAVV